jgi:diguanylate cyclase (GGDEF)-like protein/PAS domain S-box-containing protein/putative nucleotidyltransferase with HDIG domain
LFRIVRHKDTMELNHPNREDMVALIRDVADGICIVNGDGTVCFTNASAEAILGAGPGTLTGKKWDIAVSQGETVEYETASAEGKKCIVEVKASATTWKGHGALCVAVRDITGRKKRELALMESEERYALAVQGSSDGLWDWNLKNNEVFFSERWKSMLGYDQSEIGTSPDEWFSRIHPEDIAAVKAAISAHIDGSNPTLDVEHRVVHKDGAYRWWLCRGTAVFDKDGSVCRLAGSQSDITERKEAEKKLADALNDLKFALASEKVLLDELDKKNKELIELSITDGLTGLYNHRFIQERFEFEFKRVKRYGGILSCMMIDIDHFKNLNDTHGHLCGDFVLRELSSIIRTQSREVDICGRYGGEEFFIITNVPLEYTMRYATKLHTAIDTHAFEFEEKRLHVTVSIGIADFRPGMKDRHELIDRADSALYQAKEDGRNLIRIWKEKPEGEAGAVDHISAQELKRKFVHLSDQMRGTYMEYTNALVKAVDAKDPYTREHSQNVSSCGVEIAQAMGMSADDVDVIKYAGLLHDVGKISVGDDILLKKDPLTKEEFEVLKKHPVIGVNILKDIKFLEREIPIILHHHERWDGKGYPHGLNGREIPIGARILAVADAFDAMTSGRGYKKKVSLEQTIAELKRGSGSQFAPDIVEVFVRILETRPRQCE